MAKRDVNPTNYDNIPVYAGKGEDRPVHAIIETPGGIRQKFAFDPAFGIFLLKQTLTEGLTWPYDYGFVPQTLAQDGDPIDVLVLNDAPMFTGCLQRVRIIGAVRLEKNGTENDRLIACPERMANVTLKADAYDDITDIAHNVMDGIERFLVEYSADEGNVIELKRRCPRKKAMKLIERAHKRYTDGAR